MRTAYEQFQWRIAPILEHGLSRSLEQSRTYWFDETEVGYTLRLELAGVEKDALVVELLERTLSVKGTRQSVLGGHDVAYQIKLPKHADVENLSVELSNGILAIFIEKKPAARPRTIEVIAA